MKSSRNKTYKYMSLFVKSVIILIFIGIVPLVLIGIYMYDTYSKSIKSTLLMNIYNSNISVEKNIMDILSDMEKNTTYFYEYKITEYDYFYELMEDEKISKYKRESIILDILNSIKYRNKYIDNVIFITKEGIQYSVTNSTEKVINTTSLLNWYYKNFNENSKELQIIPTHDTDYYYYSKDLDFTVSRNIMNTKTIESAAKDVIGTLFIDINIECLADIANDNTVLKGSNKYIIDTKNNIFIYNSDKQKLGSNINELESYVDDMEKDKWYIFKNNNYYVYNKIDEIGWIVIDEIPIKYVDNSYRRIRDITTGIISISVILLLIIYYIYSKKTNEPIHRLKKAMEDIEGGNLNTWVEINSKDEIGFLAQGLNHMTENLKKYINKIYVAEIRQKEVQMELLKTQVQPHYMYNTLDVIRMTAITNDDLETAEMIEGLSGQLKYIIGETREMVCLKKEIENVLNYFKIIHIRYEERIDLKIEVADEILNLRVPKLILQPIVENSVKYGLRPKEGKGVVAIKAQIEYNNLYISIIDNGLGISAKNLKIIQDSLICNTNNSENNGGIGLKNVYDRIKFIFGDEYGIVISSYEGVGTSVKYTLPIIQE